MRQVLTQLHELELPLHDPATESELRVLEDVIGARVPDELSTLYLDHDGMSPCYPWEYRLMPIKEVAEVAGWRNQVSVCKQLDHHLFWSNDNSDFIGLSLSGPLEGIVSIMDHDGEPFAPAFRSVERLYEELIHCHRLEQAMAENPASGSSDTQMKSDGSRWRRFGRRLAERVESSDAEGAGEEFHQLREPSSDDASFRERPKDFGRGPFLPAEERLEEDRERVKGLWQCFRSGDPDDRPNLATCIAALTPLADSEELMPLLDDVDFFVSAVAIESLGARCFWPVVPQLKRLAIHGVSNAQSAALDSLRYFPCPDTLEFVLSILDNASFANWGPEMFMDLLVSNGCEVKYAKSSTEWRKIRYRVPDDSKWRLLKR
ncbi:SMI1/KNR4 family protein [Candidatus Sumerlaeota bacterium]